MDYHNNQLKAIQAPMNIQPTSNTKTPNATPAPTLEPGPPTVEAPGCGFGSFEAPAELTLADEPEELVSLSLTVGVGAPAPRIELRLAAASPVAGISAGM